MFGLDDAIAAGLNVLDRVLPDPAAKAQAALAMAQMKQNGDFKELDSQLQAAQQQVDVNKIEAASTSFFKSGWRPGVGWVCVIGLFSQFIVAPFATWVAALYHHPIQFPSLDMGTLLTLLLGMLGLGGMRTLEKLQGKA